MKSSPGSPSPIQNSSRRHGGGGAHATTGTQEVGDEDQPGKRSMILKFHGGGAPHTITGTQEVRTETSPDSPSPI